MKAKRTPLLTRRLLLFMGTIHLRGTAFGLVSTSIGLISLPAPYIGAVLWERFAPQVPFYVPLVATLLMLPVMWVKFKLPADESPQAN
ncbi:MAG: hypothetical protein WBW48_06195 [Anaerolineae bacterium]